MALPYQFANVSTLVTSQLDANFNAVGALAPIPCTASGTNTIVLTPGANTPPLTAYANYMLFTGVSSGTNTGACTAAVGSLAALPVYKDVPGGPIALTGGEMVALCGFELMYDSALNGGNGGWHLLSAPELSVAGGSIAGVVTFGSIALFGAGFRVGASVSSVTSLATLSLNLTTVSSITWPLIPASTSTVANLAVVGASVGDTVQIGFPASIPVGVMMFGWVSAVSTVSIRAYNGTSGSITPNPEAYRAVVQRFS